MQVILQQTCECRGGTTKRGSGATSGAVWACRCSCTCSSLDKAYEVFLSMRPNDVPPDHICYSTLIAGAHPPQCSIAAPRVHLHAIYT